MAAPPEQVEERPTDGSILHVVPAGVIWGFSFLCIKVAVEGITPLTLTALRVALGGLVVIAAARWRGARLPRGVDEWRRCGVYTLVSTLIPFTCFGWAEERVPSALAGVLNGSTPLFTLVIGLLVSHQESRLDLLGLGGLGLGFVGVALAAGIGGSDLADASSIAGALACIVASICYGIGFVYARRNLAGMGVITISCGQLIVATAIAAPLGIGSALIDGIALTPTRVLAVAVLGFVGTGLAFLFNQRALSLVGPTRASLVTYIIPVVAVTVGVLFAGERFSWRVVAGGFLVVAGVALSRPRRPTAPALVPPPG